MYEIFLGHLKSSRKMNGGHEGLKLVHTRSLMRPNHKKPLMASSSAKGNFLCSEF